MSLVGNIKRQAAVNPSATGQRSVYSQMAHFEMGSGVGPEDVFVVLIMTSPDQSRRIRLCSSHLSVNTAPRGHDCSMSLSSPPCLACPPLFTPSILFLELVI